MSNNERPIVIKRHKRHEEHESHGQWKIAYADFVTAMMAFFLIMWLLSSTTTEQREGIAKYFNTTTVVQIRSGDGVMDGGKAVLDGSPQSNEQITSSKEEGGLEGEKETAPSEEDSDPMSMFKDRVERQRFEALKAEVERISVQGELKEFADNLLIEMTPEGLRIQIFDRDGEPMFAAGSSDPSPRLERILKLIAQILGTVRNEVIVSGHTDASSFQRTPRYGNWELSGDRANSARRSLEAAGLKTERILRVEGRSAVDLLLPQAPQDPRNRRISVTVLRSDIVAQSRAAAASRNPFEGRR